MITFLFKSANEACQLTNLKYEDFWFRTILTFHADLRLYQNCWC